MVYLATIPNTCPVWGALGSSQKCGLSPCTAGKPYEVGSVIPNTTVTQCELVNTTYHASFNFTNGEQSIQVTTSPLNQDKLTTVSEVCMSKRDETFYDSGCATLTDSTNSYLKQELLRRLSYQAVMQGFNRLFTGSIYGTPEQSQTAVFRSGVLNTVLANTPELLFFSSPVDAVPYLQDTIDTSAAALQGLVTYAPTATGKPLREMLEQLFSNITISLMSSSQLQ